MFGSKLTPEEKAAKEARKAQERAARRAAQIEMAKIRAAAEKARFEAMGHYMVRETREVRVKAGNMQDAIALAAAAFKEGQDEDGTIKWHKPWNVEGDTVEQIRIVNVKAVEDDD